MPNMSYCRFRNTLIDLIDCYDNMDREITDPLEKKAKEKLIIQCCEIAIDYGYEVGYDLE